MGASLALGVLRLHARSSGHGPVKGFEGGQLVLGVDTRCVCDEVVAWWPGCSEASAQQLIAGQEGVATLLPNRRARAGALGVKFPLTWVDLDLAVEGMLLDSARATTR